MHTCSPSNPQIGSKQLDVTYPVDTCMTRAIVVHPEPERLAINLSGAMAV